VTTRWECNICHATADIDQTRRPLVYNAHYPAETGPYADRRPNHSCPIKQGLVPPQIVQHPNARKVR
jgi:hypothetical protein